MGDRRTRRQHGRRWRGIAWVGLGAVAVACVGGTGPTVDPGSAADAAAYATLAPPAIDVAAAPQHLDVDATRARAAWIGPRGGSLKVEAADGATFELTFPELAVQEPTAITMAPVQDIDGLPLSGGTAGAVWLQPAGLVLAEPAVLAIRSGKAVPAGLRPVGFDVSDDGAMELMPYRAGGGAISVTVFHFSAVGAGWGTSTDLQRFASTAPSGRMGGLLSRFLAYDVPWAETDQLVAFGLLTGLWDQALRPALEGAATDDQLLRLIGDWRQFVFLVNLLGQRGDIDAAMALGTEVGPLPVLMEPLRGFHALGIGLIAVRVEEAIAGNQQRCHDAHDLGSLANMWYWAEIGRRYAPGERDWDAAPTGCAALVVSLANLPSVLASGGRDTIQLQFALDFEDGARVPVDVDAHLSGINFEFFPDAGTELRRAVAGSAVLQAGITATASAPYTLGSQMCWVLGGVQRLLCGSDSRQFGEPVTPGPTPTATASAGPVASLLGCYVGTRFGPGGHNPLPITGSGAVCVRDGSMFPFIGRPTLAVSFSLAYLHGHGPMCLFDLGIPLEGGDFSRATAVFCGQDGVVLPGYHIDGRIDGTQFSFTIDWTSPEGERFDWGSFVLDLPPF